MSTTTSDITNFDAWLGKTEQYHDVCNDKPIMMMKAILNQYGQPIKALPPLYHWLYFLPIFNQEVLASDGHPTKGGFLPPIPFPKRMWAGGRLQFLQPILVNQKLRRESEILKIDFKQGKSGDLYFVTVKHSIFSLDNETYEEHLAIIEEHDIVYRQATSNLGNSTTQPKLQAQATNTPERSYSYKNPFSADTVTLFRYSALTFNGHKIHYDRKYCLEEEGYPGLVVHGPLMATLLLHFLQQEFPDKNLATFEFRAVQPVFDFNEFFVCGDIQDQTGEVWIEHTNGQTAMAGNVTFK